MNFQDLKKIEKHTYYIDVAFKKATNKVNDIRHKVKIKYDKLVKSKSIEQSRIDVIKESLNNQLNKILEAFPSIDNLEIFYLELIKTTLDYRDLKKSLGALKWATGQISKLHRDYNRKISKATDYNRVNEARRQFYGRVSSVLKQIRNNLDYLEESRKTMKDFPAIKTKLFTVCIFGYPNAGKSTLLKNLTDAEPEIKSYAFTTKKLNLGYINDPRVKVQIIDTPGTLNRLNKMNFIEFQAHLAVKHLADLVIYVFDPMFEKELKEQKKLLLKLKEYGKEIILYISKTDIAPQENIDKFSKFKSLNLDELHKDLLKRAMKHGRKEKEL
jgi:nucleolar GTP-binding protein